ncbi:S-layer homology domain-containing protein [Leptolyngbya sp. FACHB-671]|uniref:S-layer homology domain-containing protein n=1 Tax=Leptolyngbya sp. FACHB-671 TaxID=2692812 RepID=UPI001689C10D|nr:S-layer homology domain-containing protein [Leptolyngbya sp. FACHB-671]MBD2066049.1 S-layer homology domain-containing protein [Leptolyngbya sp. FACHB-671]
MSISSQLSKTAGRFMIFGILAALFVQSPVQAKTTFPDVRPDDWASVYIQALAERGIILGFPDGSFRPNDPVTRAQFAVMIGKAFKLGFARNAIRFTDVPNNYWAANAIQKAYTARFLSGYPESVFMPDQPMPRVQVFVALASGLQLSDRIVGSSDAYVGTLKDSKSIPEYALNGLLEALSYRFCINYPDVHVLNPNRASTRAEVAASIYQALVATGQAPRIPSPYIFEDFLYEPGRPKP